MLTSWWKNPRKCDDLEHHVNFNDVDLTARIRLLAAVRRSMALYRHIAKQ